METIIAIFKLAPVELTLISAIALLGAYAAYKLARSDDRTSRIACSLLIALAAVVPLAIFLLRNYYVETHQNPHPLALNPLPMRPHHLLQIYIAWWCIISVLACMVLVWRRWRAA